MIYSKRINRSRRPTGRTHREHCRSTWLAMEERCFRLRPPPPPGSLLPVPGPAAGAAVNSGWLSTNPMSMAGPRVRMHWMVPGCVGPSARSIGLCAYSLARGWAHAARHLAPVLRCTRPPRPPATCLHHSALHGHGSLLERQRRWVTGSPPGPSTKAVRVV